MFDTKFQSSDDSGLKFDLRQFTMLACLWP